VAGGLVLCPDKNASPINLKLLWNAESKWHIKNVSRGSADAADKPIQSETTHRASETPTLTSEWRRASRVPKAEKMQVVEMSAYLTNFCLRRLQLRHYQTETSRIRSGLDFIDLPLLILLLLFLLLILGRSSSKKPKAAKNSFKSDRDEKWRKCSSRSLNTHGVDWRSRIFDLTSSFQNGGHDVISVLNRRLANKSVSIRARLCNKQRIRQFLIYSSYTFYLPMWLVVELASQLYLVMM